MHYGLLGISILLEVLRGSSAKGFGAKHMRNLSDTLAFNLVVTLVAAIIAAILGGAYTSISVYTLLFGLIFGLVTASSLLFNVLALANGPMSYTVFITCCGMLIPTFAGITIWHETIYVAQIIGLVLLLSSLAMGINPKKDRRITGKWLLYSLLAMSSSGAVGVLQKIHQSSAYASEMNGLIMVAFFAAAGLLGIVLLILRFCRREPISRSFSWRSSALGLAVLAGIGSGTTNLMNLYLAGVLPSVIMFPIFNGGVILINAIVARVFFKEKMSVMQVIGLCIGALSIAMIGNAFSFLN